MAKKTTSKASESPKEQMAKDETPATEDTNLTETSPEAQAQTPGVPADDTGSDGLNFDTSTPEATKADAKAASPDTDTLADTDGPSTPDSEDIPEPKPEPAQDKPKHPEATAQNTGRPSAMPMLLGGVAAGAVGFAAAYFGLAQQSGTQSNALSAQVQAIEAKLEDQTTSLSTLNDQVATLGDGPDLAPVTEQLTGLTEAIANLSDRVVTSETTLDAIDRRLRQVEQRPVTENASEAAIAAYEQELEAARTEIAEQRAELEALIETALSTENNAEDAARTAIKRAATSRILAALESGTGFAGAVTDLQDAGVDVPAPLVDAADAGVPAIATLQDAFPDAARAALTASRSASTQDGGGFSAFMRAQLGARSLEPREGNDPDAVLSRAEAALRDGRLADALAEIEALPQEGRAELSDWTGQVAKRMAAVSAAQSLSENLN